jgi:hypothetical protein
MRRKTLKFLLKFMLLALLLFALYALWVAWQQGVTAALHSGVVGVEFIGRQLLLPQAQLLTGLLAAFFFFLTISLISLITWLLGRPTAALETRATSAPLHHEDVGGTRTPDG